MCFFVEVTNSPIVQLARVKVDAVSQNIEIAYIKKFQVNNCFDELVEASLMQIATVRAEATSYRATQTSSQLSHRRHEIKECLGTPKGQRNNLILHRGPFTAV